ncbi:hypothetical protein KGG77_gp15 [Streptomyces phage Omar]|uniref:Uncharacterized protein n=1 Tax=Streptomyces phage Omar TaxID=2059882 RepID=A0A2H5BLS2_9CAUD|nr:hypothetical protein KGG77_gp15 [Streptomyces phage Omar]AUG87253.1 hypothetical protein SEA_OMAR_69 [Streptomyces phage Omar]
MTFTIGARQNEGEYWVSETVHRPGHLVQVHERAINGTRYGFARLTFDDGRVSITAVKAGSPNRLGEHHFEGRPDFLIGERFAQEDYRMRSVPGGYPGDEVHHHSRVINGTRYEFTRIAWGDGLVTVGVSKEGEVDYLHHFHSTTD